MRGYIGIVEKMQTTIMGVKGFIAGFGRWVVGKRADMDGM